MRSDEYGDEGAFPIGTLQVRPERTTPDETGTNFRNNPRK